MRRLPRRPSRPAPGAKFLFAALAAGGILLLCLVIWGGAWVQTTQAKTQHTHAQTLTKAGVRRQEQQRQPQQDQHQLGDSSYVSAHRLIYGTAWKESSTAGLVADAIASGFRYIDTANQPKHYNEAGVGEGVALALAADPSLSRGDLVLQTKFSPVKGQDPETVPFDPGAPLPQQVRESVAGSLRNLRTDRLDVLLLHSPLPRAGDTALVWRTFEHLVDEGKVGAIGLSNVYDLGVLLEIFYAARIKPSVLENRFHAKTNFDVEVRRFCGDHGIQYQVRRSLKTRLDET